MIGRTTKGRSFKGVVQYVMHDKGAQSADRVAFVETLNLPTQDAQRAAAHMIDVAANAQALKQAAGIKAGRPLEKPVYHYTLAWHPSEKPNQAEQIEAAKESIKAIGLDDRQALIVSHNDTTHPHVHVIVNRVCPETGKAAGLSNDRLKLSAWAKDYEERRGQIFCEQRGKNQEAREQGQWVKDQSPSRTAWMAWKKAETKSLWAEYRATRDAAQEARKSEYDGLWQKRRDKIEVRKAEIKRQYRPQWREVFQRQRQELRDYDRHLSVRLRHAVRTQGLSIKGMWAATVNDPKVRQELIQRHERERKDLGGRQYQDIGAAIQEATKKWKRERDQLKADHRIQDQERLADTKAKTDQVWTQRGNPLGSKSKRQDRKEERSTIKSFLKSAIMEQDKADPKAQEEREERKRLRRERDKHRDTGRTMKR